MESDHHPNVVGLQLEGGKIWQGVLDCPWHHFQYDIRTGENLYPKRIYPLNALPKLNEQISSLCVYPVQIVDEQVQVGVSEGCESE